jgi:cell division protein FtsL
MINIYGISLNTNIYEIVYTLIRLLDVKGEIKQVYYHIHGSIDSGNEAYKTSIALLLRAEVVYNPYHQSTLL